MRFLVVDDDIWANRLIAHTLEKHGEVVSTANGDEALAAIQESWSNAAAFDLVCLDIDMPGVDGHATLAAIRALEETRGVEPGRGVAVVMVSGHREPDHFFAAFREGCEAYLVKPVTAEKLLFHLHRLGVLKSESAAS